MIGGRVVRAAAGAAPTPAAARVCKCQTGKCNACKDWAFPTSTTVSRRLRACRAIKAWPTRSHRRTGAPGRACAPDAKNAAPRRFPARPSAPEDFRDAGLRTSLGLAVLAFVSRLFWSWRSVRSRGRHHGVEGCVAAEPLGARRQVARCVSCRWMAPARRQPRAGDVDDRPICVRASAHGVEEQRTVPSCWEGGTALFGQAKKCLARRGGVVHQNVETAASGGFLEQVRPQPVVDRSARRSRGGRWSLSVSNACALPSDRGSHNQCALP